MHNIDRIAFLVLLALLFSAINSSSDIMGVLALLFSGIVIFKNIFSLKTHDFSLKPFQKAVFIYFLIELYLMLFLLHYLPPDMIRRMYSHH